MMYIIASRQLFVDSSMGPKKKRKEIMGTKLKIFHIGNADKVFQFILTPSMIPPNEMKYSIVVRDNGMKQKILFSNIMKRK